MDEIKKELTEIHAKNKNFGRLSNKLKDYSFRLANFQASDWNSELEIPGQYSGESKPLVKYHAKISSFSPKVSHINSLRKPFKIVMFGNDSKEYSFLVKFGEDLRQDQRIQQLFSLANNILKSDFNCQQRNLYIEQYQVIPLSKSLGLIKMVENTISISDLIDSSCPDEKTIKEYKLIQVEYVKWIRNASKDVHITLPECYAKACLVYDKNETNRMFTKLVNSIPHDILSKAFWTISMDTESYIYLRHQFITSYSTMCIVHWLLGIGDRNLGNCLISKKTGRAIGIDFGYAFGASTQHSPIPELIPFRLTPHILALIDPLKETGFVEYTMVHSLKALRKKKYLFMSTMDVFVKDPSVDWLEYAKSQNEFDSDSWYPQQKIEIASQKLDGANPIGITIQELKSGKVANYLEAFIKIAQGDESSTRRLLPLNGLNEEQQVKCLLDQATDYNILGRAFAGLQLWM